MAVRAMREGAFDFDEKPINNQTLMETVDTAINESVKLIDTLCQQEKIQNRLDSFTSREHRVLEMIAAGKLSKQIAYDLGITQRTGEAHRARVMAKMQSKTVADLLQMIVYLDIFTANPNYKPNSNPNYLIMGNCGFVRIRLIALSC